MFAMYRAPRQDAPKARVPVIEADAEAAERAVQAILAEGEHLHKLLVGWYVHKLTAHELQQELHCSRATVYRWRDEALDFFARLYKGKVKK
jgi:AraC-like DNA-binding protein